MRKSKPVVFFIWAATLIFLGSFLGQAMAKEAPRMTKEELKGLMEKPDVVVIDVRAQSDWDGSKEKIQGAVREDPKKVKEWANKYGKDKTLVFYCAWKGEGTSARVAQDFVEMGYAKAYALKGGWNEWLKAQFPVEAK
jgi:thiosulfate sulfurtransferase